MTDNVRVLPAALEIVDHLVPVWLPAREGIGHTCWVGGCDFFLQAEAEQPRMFCDPDEVEAALPETGAWTV